MTRERLTFHAMRANGRPVYKGRDGRPTAFAGSTGLQPSGRRFAFKSSGAQYRMIGVGSDRPGAELMRVNIPRRSRGKVSESAVFDALLARVI